MSTFTQGAGVHFICSFENIKSSWIPKFSLRQNGFMNDLHMFALRMMPISDCTQLGKRGFGLEPIASRDFASMTLCLLHWSHTQYLEGHSSNAHLRVSSVILIIWRIRCVWLGLELNCAELWGIECETKLPTHHWSRSYNCVFLLLTINLALVRGVTVWAPSAHNAHWIIRRFVWVLCIHCWVQVADRSHMTTCSC